jgi:hypothetical protein
LVFAVVVIHLDSTIERIAKALGTPIIYFFEGYRPGHRVGRLGARNLARKHQQRAIRVIALAVEIPGGFRVEDANFR